MITITIALILTNIAVCCAGLAILFTNKRIDMLREEIDRLKK